MSKKSNKAGFSMIAKVRFYVDALVISSVVAVLMIPAIYLFRSKKGIIMHHLNRLIMRLIGARIEVVDGVLDQKADMYLMNHQGIIDIIAFEAYTTRHLRWAAKKELFETPWFGLLLRYADMICLDRDSKAALVSLLKGVRESIEILQRPVGIFPEGTRAKDQQLLPFKPGAQIVAQKLKLKVQPVVIIGSKHILNEHEKTAHKGSVRFVFLPTIDLSVSSPEWYKQTQERMQQVIDTLYHSEGLCR